MRMILGLDAPTAAPSPWPAGPTASTRGRCRSSGRCSRPARSTPRGPPTTTCSPSRRRTASGRPACARSSSRSASTEVASKRAGGFSLGMGQRLGIATALLADPGRPPPRRARQRPRPRGHPLDPRPAQGLRGRRPDRPGLQPPDERDGRHRRARPGPRPRPAARRPADERAARPGRQRRRARPHAGRRRARPSARRHRRDRVPHRSSRSSRSRGPTAAQVGDLARDLRISIHGLVPQQVSLEEAFMDMTRDDVEFHATPAPPATRPAP